MSAVSGSDSNIDLLLVEDTPEDVELTLEAFSEHLPVIRIHVAHDGEEALQFLFGPHGKEPRDPLPKVVLLDLKLPKIDGLEVLERIRADPSTRTLPVVLLTSSSEESDMHRGYLLHANSYIVKPVVFEDFVRAVNDIGMYWLGLNRAPTRSQAGLP